MREEFRIKQLKITLVLAGMLIVYAGLMAVQSYERADLLQYKLAQMQEK